MGAFNSAERKYKSIIGPYANIHAFSGKNDINASWNIVFAKFNPKSTQITKNISVSSIVELDLLFKLKSSTVVKTACINAI